MAVTESVTVQLGDVFYHLFPSHEAEVHDHTPEVRPAFVIDSSTLNLDNFAEHFGDTISTFQQNDDVFTPEFARDATYFVRGINKSSSQWQELQSAWKSTQNDKLLLHLESSFSIPKGPYFWKGNYLHQSWRLYPDYLSAFVTPVIPSAEKYRFQPLRSAAGDGSTLAVAVPSRLYFETSAEKPLNGKRIGVKDNIHVAGVKTSNGNRAYTDCYGPQTETAAYVKELINKGAIILGKQKMSAFAGFEKPPDQTIDYFAPWNPRADGYQRPAASSSGAGSSIAGYDWIDYSIGTDTTGSIREPARVCGVFGLKMTNRVTPADGLDPSSAEIDSYGLLARSIDGLFHLVESSLGPLIKVPAKLPKKIIYPTDWLPYQLEEQQKLNEEFLQVLETALGVTSTEICLADEWKRTAPEPLRDIPISTYLENSGFWPLYYDNYHNNDQFREDYRRKFGKEAYVSPPQGWKWDLGSKITREEKERGLAEIKVYQDWVREFILPVDSEGDFEAIIFLPLRNAKPDYRDTQNKLPQVVQSFEPKYFASVLGLPQIVVPIAQLPYESRVSKRTEYIPVITTFAGPKGSDLLLVKVAEAALKAGGYSTSVETGRFTFPPTDNFRHSGKL